MGYFDQRGDPVNPVGIRPEGQGIPVSYLWRVFELSTGENLMVLNRGVPDPERRACFGGQSSLDLTDEDGRHLAKRIRMRDLTQEGQEGNGKGVPDFPSWSA